jgi:rhodanese-related sulfurtransferase
MNLDQKDWLSQLEADPNAVILDVCTQSEWEEGIIPTPSISTSIKDKVSFMK